VIAVHPENFCTTDGRAVSLWVFGRRKICRREESRGGEKSVEQLGQKLSPFVCRGRSKDCAQTCTQPCSSVGKISIFQSISSRESACCSFHPGGRQARRANRLCGSPPGVQSLCPDPPGGLRQASSTVTWRPPSTAFHLHTFRVIHQGLWQFSSTSTFIGAPPLPRPNDRTR